MNNFKVTTAAADKLYELITEEDNFNLKLRVFVQGGGCSGFQYGFTFDEFANEDDLEVNVNTSTNDRSVQVLVDGISYQYLVGGEIDYKEDKLGSQFIIKNPNANTTCGCGSSFSS